MTQHTSPLDDKEARQNVIVLVLAQSILGAQLPIAFIVGGLAGGQLASNICFATLPISLIVFGSMTTAPWISPLMQRFGRAAGFLVGAAAGTLGALLCSFALYLSSFPLFLLGSYLTGIYMSAHGFYRFAAADSASEAFRPKAISYVMAGGLVAAILGPQLNKFAHDATVVPFLGSYIAMAGLNSIGAFLFFFFRAPKPSAPSATQAASGGTRIRSYGALLKTPSILVAIICGMVSYALMNLVMTSTSIAVVGCGYTTNNANDIVTAHVLAMYAPSFFTGYLISRFGVERIIGIGLALLAASGAFALAGIELSNFFVALILLGVGWNFGFIGATSLLSASHTAAERGRVQGLNDGIVFGFVTLASLSSGGLMNCSGGSAIEGWAAVNYAMTPFLLLAGSALLYLVLRRARAV